MSQPFGRDLTTGSIPRLMLTFSVPMLLSSFLQTAYSIVNAIWVGQYLGTAALAAVTVSFPVIFVVFGLGMGLTLATNILVSQSFGARRFDELREVVDSSVLVIGSLGVVLAVLGEVFAPAILRVMGTDPAISGIAIDYLQVVLFTIPLSFGVFLLRSLMQGIGLTKPPLVFQTVSVLFMAILDPLLMLGWAGFPKLGLVGTAWASVIAQSLVVIALVVFLRWQDAPVAPRLPRLAHLGPMTRKTLHIGLPASLQQVLVSMGMVVVTGLVNRYGPTATAAFGAAGRIDQLAILPAMTLSMAISTLAGQNIGAGRHDRVREIFRWGSLMSGGITGVVAVLAVLMPARLLHVFVSDPAVQAAGASYLAIVAPCYVFLALATASNGVINGSGRTVVTSVITLISFWLIRIPAGYWLSARLGSVDGVWWAIAMGSIVSLALSWSYYFSGLWQKPLANRVAGRGPSPATGTGRT